MHSQLSVFRDGHGSIQDFPLPVVPCQRVGGVEVSSERPCRALPCFCVQASICEDRKGMCRRHDNTRRRTMNRGHLVLRRQFHGSLVREPGPGNCSPVQTSAGKAAANHGCPRHTAFWRCADRAVLSSRGRQRAQNRTLPLSLRSLRYRAKLLSNCPLQQVEPGAEGRKFAKN